MTPLPSCVGCMVMAALGVEHDGMDDTPDNTPWKGVPGTTTIVDVVQAGTVGGAAVVVGGAAVVVVGVATTIMICAVHNTVSLAVHFFASVTVANDGDGAKNINSRGPKKAAVPLPTTEMTVPITEPLHGPVFPNVDR